MEFIRTKAQLESHLKTIGYQEPIPDIAVEGLIFNNEGKLVLLLRGDKARDERFKLEGIGGRVQMSDKEDFPIILKKKVLEEIGQAPYDPIETEIEVDRLLEVRVVKFKNAITQKWVTWAVISHLCRLVKGTPFNREPSKHMDIRCLSLNELFDWQTEPIFDESGKLLTPGLSKSLIVGRETYKIKYGDAPYFENNITG